MIILFPNIRPSWSVTDTANQNLSIFADVFQKEHVLLSFMIF